MNKFIIILVCVLVFFIICDNEKKIAACPANDNKNIHKDIQSIRPHLNQDHAFENGR